MKQLVDLLFAENEIDISLEVCEHLLELCRALLSVHPLRKILLSSDVFQDYFLNTVGAVDILFGIGFQEDEDCFSLPLDFQKEPVLQLQSSLESSKSAAVDLQQSQEFRSQRLHFSGLPTASNPGEFRFQSEVVSFLNQVQQHEVPERQQKALSVLPLDELKSKAQQKNGPLNGLSKTVNHRDLLVLELLVWFKSSFFRWVDTPRCPWCGVVCTRNGSTTPTPMELLWGAHRVEAYACENCHVNVRFPRYNDPAHLLVTRRGRCGEWANCFLLFLRSLGYEARFINDGKDHVWTEMYSESQKRWMHCDPCECSCDKPLLYEKGWKKDLSYVWAFAADHLQDVTWRYTSDHRTVIIKRQELRENWLIALIQALTTRLQKMLGVPRKEELLQRNVSELVEFLSSPVSDGNLDLHGRTSGSLAWRVSRGEFQNSHPTKTGFVFTPSPNEVSTGKMEVVYSPVTDSYKRLSVISEDFLSGWNSGAWEFKDIFRKEEHDWKQVYLCVQEGCKTGHLTWCFRVQDGCHMRSVSVVCKSTVFQKGIVWWTLTDGKITVDIHNGELQECLAFDGATELKLSAKLVCGEFWQHAQLFRMDTKSRPASTDFPLHVCIKFSNDKTN